MNRLRKAAIARILVSLAVAFTLAGAAGAVGPAHDGPMGNAEEPALRPYKWMWRGLKALVYRPLMAIEKGNRKTPGLGTVELFRGIRKGMVELDESIVKGAMCSAPPKGKDYKEVGKVNASIDEDILLRNVADIGVAGGVLGVGAGGGIWLGQKVVDHYPLNTPERQAEILKQARTTRQARKEAARARNESASPLEVARRKYVGDRAEINPKPEGNLLKLAQ